MTTKTEFEAILLPNWKPWDGSGNYYVPARNTRLEDDSHIGIIISEDGIQLYKCWVEKVNADEEHEEGDMFLDGAYEPEELHKLKKYLSDELILECVEMHERYMATQNTKSKLKNDK